MYLQALSDLPLNLLETAFQSAVLECKFFPSIAEIRAIVARSDSPEQHEASYQRLKARIESQPEVKQLRSILDEQAKTVKREVVALTEGQWRERLEKLAGQKLKLLGD
jgi:hypothetical protein